MPAITTSALDQALALLGSVMAYRQRDPIHLVVCGGSALIALHLVSRTTKDVDVLATLEDHQLQCARPLPNWLLADAEDVRKELGLPDHWLNDGPADPDMFRLGLPEGVVGRLHTREITPAFKVSFIDRFDQIHLKLYAAVDQGGRHFTDLRQLQPSEEELLAAARWTFTHDPSEGFRQGMESVFKALVPSCKRKRNNVLVAKLGLEAVAIGLVLAPKARPQCSLGQRPRSLRHNGLGLKARNKSLARCCCGPSALIASLPQALGRWPRPQALGRWPRLHCGRAVGPELPTACILFAPNEYSTSLREAGNNANFCK